MKLVPSLFITLSLYSCGNESLEQTTEQTLQARNYHILQSFVEEHKDNLHTTPLQETYEGIHLGSNLRSWSSYTLDTITENVLGEN